MLKAIILLRLHYGLSEKGVDATVEICSQIIALLKANLRAGAGQSDLSRSASFDSVYRMLEEVRSKYQRREWIENHIQPAVSRSCIDLHVHVSLFFFLNC